MRKLIDDWNELLIYEKVFYILGLVFGVTTIVLGIISLCGTVNVALMVLSGAIMVLCLAIRFWRKQKGAAICYLCTSVFMILAVIISLSLR